MRQGIASLAACILIAFLACTADAEQPGKLYRIGYLSPRAGIEPHEQAFLQSLRELGYTEGKNIVIEWRFANARTDVLPRFAAELVSLKVDLILARTTPVIQAAMKATERIPIVMVVAVNPVEVGLVDSLARPGGNLTGLTSISAELYGKRLELLKEIVPRLSRVAVLHDPAFGSRSPLALKEVEGTAGQLGLKLQALDVRGAEDFEPAFRAAKKSGSQALIHFNHTIIVNHLTRVAELAAKNRLPAIYNDAQFMETGGLMSYGTNGPDLFRRAAVYVDKILKGVKPADLPVEQPTKFELVINLKTAKQIGLTIPPNMLYRADRVIK